MAGMSGSSIVPSTWEWLARICSMQRRAGARQADDEDRIAWRRRRSRCAAAKNSGVQQRLAALHVRGHLLGPNSAMPARRMTIACGVVLEDSA